MSMFVPSSNLRQHRKVYRKRRRYRERLDGEPLRRRIATRIEHTGKWLFDGILGRLIAPPPIDAPLDPRTLRRVLIIRNDAIGDMVLTTPFWRILKKHFPHLEIGIVGSFRNLPVVANDPDIDLRFENNGATLREVWKTASRVRKYRWDLVIPMIYNKKNKMAILAKIFAPGAFSSMILLPDDPLERYRKLFSICVRSTQRLRPEEGPILDLMRIHFEGTLKVLMEDHEWRPSLRVGESAVHSINASIRSLLESDGTKHYFHINLDAKMEFKEFGLAKSFALSKLLLERYSDYSVIWTSSPFAAQQAIDFLKLHASTRLHFQPTASVHELTGIVRGARIVISPDTSVIHIASAEQTPVIGLYHILHEWLPYKVPCRVLTPSYGDPVSTIAVERVCDAVQELLPEKNLLRIEPVNFERSPSC